MYRTFETIFRRPVGLLALMLILPVMSLVIAYFLPRSYQTTASLWALKRYEVIGATGPETDLLSTPATTQATALGELLRTRAFALEVADGTHLASTLDAQTRADSQLRDDALFADISQNVQVLAAGYNLFTITYTNRNPYIAKEVVDAVIANYSLQSQGLTIVEGQHLLDSYQTQLADAKQKANQAGAAESAYLARHPDLAQQLLRTNPQYAELTDPQYALLHSQTQQAQTNVQNIQTDIATVNQEISAQGKNADNLFKVIDAPTVPSRPVSRQRSLLIAGGAGLALAIIAFATYVVISLRRDRSIYTVPELEKVSSVLVVMQLPALGGNSQTLLAERLIGREWKRDYA